MPVCAIHQPQFLPWLGYLDKINRADIFVFLDDVQFKKNEFQNRNRILVFGRPQWITVPVRFKFGDTLRRTLIAETPDWRRKMWGTIEHNYGKTPFFSEYASGLKAVLWREWKNLAELNTASVQWLMECFAMRKTVRFSSDMAGLSNDPTQRLIDICGRAGGDVYLSGAGGKDYLDVTAFAARGMAIVFQEYRHPVYPQKSAAAPPAFTPYLSAVDALFNIGGGERAKAELFGTKKTATTNSGADNAHSGNGRAS